MSQNLDGKINNNYSPANRRNNDYVNIYIYYRF